MITDGATLSNEYSCNEALNSMGLNVVAMKTDEFMFISLTQLELMECILGAEECFDDWETEYAFG